MLAQRQAPDRHAGPGEIQNHATAAEVFGLRVHRVGAEILGAAQTGWFAISRLAPCPWQTQSHCGVFLHPRPRAAN